MKLIKLTNETITHTLCHFLIQDYVEDPKANIRKAIKEFLHTDEGITANTTCPETFDWYYAIECVPDAIWSKHGLVYIYGNIDTVAVDANENLGAL